MTNEQPIADTRSRWVPSYHYEQRPFHDLLDRAASLSPEKVGVMVDADTYTYRELQALSIQFANGLRSQAIGHGDRVAVCLTNRIEWIVAVFAISRVGASTVLVSSAWREAEVRHAFETAEPSGVVAEEYTADVVEAAGRPAVAIAIDGDREGWASFWDLVNSSSTMTTDHPEIDVRHDEVVLPFSSGTTGFPKAVRHSHASVMVSVAQWMSALNLGEHDVMQNYAPLAHILGVVNVGAPVAARAPLRLFKRFDVDAILDSIEYDRVTIGIAVAPVAVALANHPRLEEFDLSSLRYFNWSATPVLTAIAERFTERTGIRWMPAYGASESPVLFANPVRRPDLWRLDSAGLPVADVEAAIIDLATGEFLKPGTAGEIVVRSPNQMMGYLPESANEDAWLDGNWYRTGDVGWLEPEGWLHITDRVKEMIRTSGFQVAPAELEGLLYEHPDVADCAVFAVPDEVTEQKPAAVVVLRPDATSSGDELISWLTPRLATYKRLARLEIVDAIPRTASGKTLRRELTERYR